MRYSKKSYDLKMDRQNRKHIQKKDKVLAKQSRDGFNFQSIWDPNAPGGVLIPLLLLGGYVAITNAEIQNRSTFTNNNRVNKHLVIESCPAYPYNNTTNTQPYNYESKVHSSSTSTNLYTKDISCNMKAAIIGVAEIKIEAKHASKFPAHSHAYDLDISNRLRGFLSRKLMKNDSSEKSLELCYDEVFDLNRAYQAQAEGDRTAHDESYNFIESYKKNNKLDYKESIDKWIQVNGLLTQNQPDAQLGIREHSILAKKIAEAPDFWQFDRMFEFLENSPDELEAYVDFLDYFYRRHEFKPDDPKGNVALLNNMLARYLNSYNNILPSHLHKDFARISSFIKKYYWTNSLTKEQILDQLEGLFLNLQQSKLTPIENAAFAHMLLVEIHPFPDGNGRTARLLQNTILNEAGYPAIPVGEGYLEAVNLSIEKKDYTPYQNYLCSIVDIKWRCLQTVGEFSYERL